MTEAESDTSDFPPKVIDALKYLRGFEKHVSQGLPLGEDDVPDLLGVQSTESNAHADEIRLLKHIEDKRRQLEKSTLDLPSNSDIKVKFSQVIGRLNQNIEDYDYVLSSISSKVIKAELERILKGLRSNKNELSGLYNVITTKLGD